MTLVPAFKAVAGQVCHDRPPRTIVGSMPVHVAGLNKLPFKLKVMELAL
jgi:hypothetical protein